MILGNPLMRKARLVDIQSHFFMKEVISSEDRFIYVEDTSLDGGLFKNDSNVTAKTTLTKVYKVEKEPKKI